MEIKNIRPKTLGIIIGLVLSPVVGIMGAVMKYALLFEGPWLMSGFLFAIAGIHFFGQLLLKDMKRTDEVWTRSERNCCKKCGFSLESIETTNQCPECGMEDPLTGVPDKILPL